MPRRREADGGPSAPRTIADAADDYAAVSAARTASTRTPPLKRSHHEAASRARQVDRGRERYAALIVARFSDGTFPGLRGGESLRNLLADLLQCTGMRVTKKYSRTRLLRKTAFVRAGELGADGVEALESARREWLDLLKDPWKPVREAAARNEPKLNRALQQLADHNASGLNDPFPAGPKPRARRRAAAFGGPSSDDDRGLSSDEEYEPKRRKQHRAHPRGDGRQGRAPNREPAEAQIRARKIASDLKEQATSKTLAYVSALFRRHAAGDPKATLKKRGFQPRRSNKQREVATIRVPPPPPLPSPLPPPRREHDPGPRTCASRPRRSGSPKKPDEAPSPEEIKKMRDARRDKDRARDRAGHSKHSAEQHRAEDKRMHEMWCVGDRVDSITCVQHEMRMLHRSIPETSKPEDPPEDRAEKARVHRERTKAELLHEKRQAIKARRRATPDVARDEDFAMREAFCADNAETKLCSEVVERPGEGGGDEGEGEGSLSE
ncbi:SET domain-containing protein [Aureococcus anophagefferens]|nr:SET domain-containing protein [Aureococcus anophagefferens]